MHYLYLESDDEVAPPPSYMAGMERRRKSVFAESYEPGEDDEAVEKVLPVFALLSGNLYGNLYGS